MGSCQGNADSVGGPHQRPIHATACVGGTVFSGATVKQQPATGTLLSGGTGRGIIARGSTDLKDRVRKYGLPTAAVCPPGQCQLGESWVSLPLLERFCNDHDTIILTFGLPDRTQPLGLSTCACVMVRADIDGEVGVVERPYTPISTNAMIGTFQLLVKVYEGGIMSQHLNDITVGSRLQFMHNASHVKIQYPFGTQHITMLVGGSGITPIVQALHAIFGTPGDATKVTLIFSNKTTQDVPCEELLDTWAELYDDRLRVIHWISRGVHDSCSMVHNHIDRRAIEKHSAPPSEDVLVMVCGPPAMYEELCGSRESAELTGLLSEMGYTAKQVVKL